MKCALLVGINYVGTGSELNGCINDVHNLKEVLISKWGYQPENITILTDDPNTSGEIEATKKPTKQNILSELYNHVKNADMTEFWFSYSGHGSYVKDLRGDENDGYDETLVPSDYSENGMISDDILHHLFSMMDSKVKAVVLIDSCHSGSMLDLKYRYISGMKRVIENPKDYIKSNVLMISGCLDDQTSADAYNINNSKKYEGAMSRSFLYVLEQNNYNMTCYKLLKEMREFLKAKNFTQIPQMCSTKEISNTSIFSNNNKEIVYLNCQ